MSTTNQLQGSALRFSVDFDVYSKTLTFTDVLQSYGAYAGAKGILSLVDPDGLTFYQNTGWATSDFSSPDTDSSVPTWRKSCQGKLSGGFKWQCEVGVLHHKLHGAGW